MSTPTAWTVIRWPEVTATLREFEKAAASMRPVSISVERRGGRFHGQAVWAGEIEGRAVGLAWDWAEVSQSVVALVDPMSVLTNVVLTDLGHRVVDEQAFVLHLNKAIYALPWQAEVLHVQQPRLQRLAA